MATTQKMDLRTYIESLPAIIGHVPARSLILAGFGETSSLLGTSRVDLPRSLETVAAHVSAVAESMRGVPRVLEWKRVLVVAWCENENTEVAEALIEATIKGCRETDWDVIGQFLVTEQAIDGVLFASDGSGVKRTYPRDPHLADDLRRQAGLADRPIPADRDAVAEQVAHDGSPATCSRPPMHRSAYLNLWNEVINTGTQDVSLLTGEQVALLSIGLLAIPVRDAILGSFTGSDNPALRATGDLGAIVDTWTDTGTHLEVTERLRLLTRRTPDGAPAAHLCAILALRAYIAGRTALAIAATERAKAIEPDHNLANILTVMIQNGIAVPA